MKAKIAQKQPNIGVFINKALTTKQGCIFEKVPFFY